jgi:hypothetical protein
MKSLCLSDRQEEIEIKYVHSRVDMESTENVYIITTFEMRI